MKGESETVPGPDQSRFCDYCSGSGRVFIPASWLAGDCFICKGAGLVPNEYRRAKEAENGPTQPWGSMKPTDVNEAQSRIDWPAYLPKGLVDPHTGNLATMEESKEIYESMIPKPSEPNSAGIAAHWTNCPSIDVSKGRLGPTPPLPTWTPPEPAWTPPEPSAIKNAATTKPTGGFVNYYLVKVDHPQREDQPPYQAECEDIIQALGMDFNEGCIFKALWRSASARLGEKKPGHSAIYDAEKVVHYANRNLRKIQNEVSK